MSKGEIAAIIGLIAFVAWAVWIVVNAIPYQGPFT